MPNPSLCLFSRWSCTVSHDSQPPFDAVLNQHSKSYTQIYPSVRYRETQAIIPLIETCLVKGRAYECLSPTPSPLLHCGDKQGAAQRLEPVLLWRGGEECFGKPWAGGRHVVNQENTYVLSCLSLLQQNMPHPNIPNKCTVAGWHAPCYPKTCPHLWRVSCECWTRELRQSTTHF